MKICYLNITKHIPTRDAVYLSGLRAHGVEIIDVRDSSPGWRKFIVLYKRHRALRGQYDILFVGYAGALLVPLARMISRKPVVFNALSPISDGVILSRHEGSPWSLRGISFWLLDFFSFHLASVNLIENNAMISYIHKKFLVPSRKMLRTWTGVDEKEFFFDASIPKLSQFTVLFRGELTNDSGIEYFVEAAKILADSDIHFRLMGRGPMAPHVEALLQTFDTKNFEWIRERVSIEELRRKMQESHVSVGWLSGRLRAPTSLPHKIFESLVLKVPFIHARLPAMQELLEEDKTGFFCKPDSVQDFVTKIVALKNNPQLLTTVAENGYRFFERELRSDRLAENLLMGLKQGGLC